MLKFWKRRRTKASVDTDNPLAIRSLLEQPELRKLVLVEDDTPEVSVSPTWNGLVASGPIRFAPTAFPDIAA